MTSPADDEEEQKRLRSAALQNAQTVRVARQRAEEELLRARDALELKTAELNHSLAMMRATLESTTDGILVTDFAGMVTGSNQKFADMWRTPPHILESRDHRQLVKAHAREFADPGRFIARIETIYASAPPETDDVLELVDGRVFERFSRLQFVDEHNVGRVWSFRDITKSKLAEAALRKQSEWLRVTLASIGDAVITTDAVGRVTSLNPVAESLTGWPTAEAEGMPLDSVFRIVDEDTRQAADNPALRALAEGRIVGLANHTLLIARDGTERAIDDSAAPIRDAVGNLIGVVLIFRDITKRRRDEERLRQSVAQFRQLGNALPQLVWTARPDGFIDFYNERWYEFTGFDRDVYGDPSWTPLLHPNDVQRTVSLFYDCIRSGRIFQIEYRFKDFRTGGYRWFLGRAYAVRDEAGRIVRWFGTCTDIDQTKRNEETTGFLAEASATLAELTDYESTLQRLASLSVPSFADWCAVDMLEPDGSVRRITVAHQDPTRVQLAQDLFRRYPPRPTDPHGVTRVIASGESEWATAIPDSMLEAMSRDPEHLRLLRELGVKSFVCVSLRSRTRTLGALTFVMAESGRSYDAQAVAAAEDLAHRAVIAIENSNLLTALKQTDRRKDEFLAILAHELRNPLAPIRNAVHILRARAAATPELDWATAVIDRQVVQMTRLVDDLLDVSRISSGKIQLQKERVDLAAVVNSSVESSRPLIEKRGLRLAVAVPDEPIQLDADLTRLSQVLLNLLNNAAKYSDRGSRITLTAEPDGNQVVVRVKDEGIGIPSEMLPRVFDMFTQVDRSLERSEGGLGIGLTLVRRLVEMHGGSVEAHSGGPGLGSEFVVRLPVAPDSQGVAPREAGQPEGLIAQARRRILVVDDNQDSADSLSMLLGMAGNDVRTTHDGLEGIAAATDFQPDVVLLDIGLPKLNGYDVARRIRAERGAGVVLIAVTGWGQAEDRRLSREAGFDHHLTKPIDLRALQKLLATLP